MDLIVRSRRKGGLSPEEFLRFRALVASNIGTIETWSDRWITSVADTYAENGEPQMLIFAAIRMMQKYAGGGGPTDDAHTNLVKRFRKYAGPTQNKLLEAFWAKLEAQPILKGCRI